jgi:hypothetical protein
MEYKLIENNLIQTPEGKIIIESELLIEILNQIKRISDNS